MPWRATCEATADGVAAEPDTLEAARRSADLDARVRAATQAAARLLGTDVPAADGGGLGALSDALVTLLAEAGDAAVRPEQDEHERRLAAIRDRPERLLGALDDVHAAIQRLGQLTTPSAMLAAAPAELAAVSPLRRVVLSSVRDGLLTVEVVSFRDDDDAAAVLPRLRAEPLRLAHRLVETEVVRRRRVAAVDDARTDPQAGAAGMADVMGWGGYVVAPLVVDGKVFALLHADRGAGQPVDVVDREVVWTFATDLARTYESASLRRGLRQEREQIGELLDWLGARSRELTGAEITLEAAVPGEVHEVAAPRVSTGAGRGDAAVFDRLLTRRELDVLRLLSDGATNGAIAEELVISAGTVKSHVNRILTKLHVANRAEAAARYYALVHAPPRGA